MITLSCRLEFERAEGLDSCEFVTSGYFKNNGKVSLRSFVER